MGYTCGMMELIEVNSPATRREFLTMPVSLYRGNRYWIRPLDDDIEAVFDPRRNPAFEHGEAARWILQQDNRTIGRIAAFVNHKTALKDNDFPVGGAGFFECINDQKAAHLLFGQAQKWLSERGMEAMDAPINFGERDRWWGLLTEGYDYEPVYCMHYHLPYYKSLMESYGFQVYFNQFTFSRNCYDPPGDKILRKAALIAKDPAYRFEHFSYEKTDHFIRAFVTIYNLSWAKVGGTSPLTYDKVSKLFQSFRPILDPQMVWFGFYNDEPISFLVQMPDFNQIVKRLNGKLNWLNKLIVAYHLYFRTIRKLFGVVFGVVPEHQGKGIDGAMIMAAAEIHFRYKRYDWLDLNWIGDFNPLMIAVCKQLGAHHTRTHTTYRKLFDPTRPFERMKIIGMR